MTDLERIQAMVDKIDAAIKAGNDSLIKLRVHIPQRTATEHGGEVNDRVKLAEAMGWIHTTGYSEGPMSGKQPFEHWSQRGGKVYDYLPFDPFTDANDDYAVLEWAYAQGGAFAERFGAELKGIWKYKKGDYARAALKVLAATEQGEKMYPCEKCGLLRTKAEGGTTFTVCDDCWPAATEQEK